MLTNLGFTTINKPVLHNPDMDNAELLVKTETGEEAQTAPVLEPQSPSAIEEELVSPPTIEEVLPSSSSAEGNAAPRDELWEEELDEHVMVGADIRTWEVLREEVKKELKRGKQTLPLSQINQYLIICNFATLRIKGLSRIAASQEIARQWHDGQGAHFARRVRALARHYQVFEHLPGERRGGGRCARSLLMDESVKLACRDWLTSQPVGAITPRLFQHALNSDILPGLNIALERPLCERTAR